MKMTIPHRTAAAGALTVLLAGAAAAAGGASHSSASATRVTGSVVLSPATPVCKAGDPCAKPLAGFELVFSRRKTTAKVKTDKEGRYTAGLQPGIYAVAAAHRSPLGRGLTPARVRIPPVRRAVRNFTYDAGIR